jgi:hypothetical protein
MMSSSGSSKQWRMCAFHRSFVTMMAAAAIVARTLLSVCKLSRPLNYSSATHQVPSLSAWVDGGGRRLQLRLATMSERQPEFECFLAQCAGRPF